MKRWQGRRQRTWRQVAGPAAAATLSLRRRAATRGPGVPALGTATVSALAPTAPPPDTTRHAGGWDALVQNQLACPPRTTPCRARRRSPGFAVPGGPAPGHPCRQLAGGHQARGEGPDFWLRRAAQWHPSARGRGSAEEAELRLLRRHQAPGWV